MPSYSENTSRLIRLLELQGRKGTGFAVMADIRGKTQTKHNGASQGEEQRNVRIGGMREGVTVFAVGATS